MSGAVKKSFLFIKYLQRMTKLSKTEIDKLTFTADKTTAALA